MDANTFRDPLENVFNALGYHRVLALKGPLDMLAKQDEFLVPAPSTIG